MNVEYIRNVYNHLEGVVNLKLRNFISEKGESIRLFGEDITILDVSTLELGFQKVGLAVGSTELRFYYGIGTDYAPNKPKTSLNDFIRILEHYNN